MKQILVLGSVSIDPGEVSALERMAAFVGDAVGVSQGDVDVSYCHMDEVNYLISNDGAQIIDSRNNRDIADYDLIFFRGKFRPNVHDIALICSYALEHDTVCVNSAFGRRRAIGKIPQMYHLYGLGLPIPKTLSATNARLPELIQAHLGFPVVVKDVQGAHGDTNFLVTDAQQLQGILTKYTDVRFMAQEVIPNDGDFRVLIAGSQTMVIHRQGSGDTHLNNTSQGAQATIIADTEFLTGVIAQSRTFADYCDYEIAGVDVIFHKDTGKHYFLEINSQPQIASGAFVPEKAELLGGYFRQLLGL